MTTELRQISFEPSEVCAAIQDYRRRRAEPLPPGNVVNIKFGVAPDITATLDIENIDGSAKTTVTLASEAVAAALILFCINRKIPLPAKAEKKLQRVGEGLCLMIRQNFKVRQMA